MRINNNIMAMNTYRQLGLGNAAGARSMEKLSSGYRINRAGDDAAGLAISEKMRGQIRGLNQASRNAQDGISLIQTAEGALAETHAMLQRMRELTVQSNNGTNTADDLKEIQKEITELSDEITRIAEKTEFNTKALLDGSLGAKGTFGTATVADAATVSFQGLTSGDSVSFNVATATGVTTLTATFGDITQSIDITNSLATNDIKAGTVLNFDAIGLKLEFTSAVATSDLVADTVDVNGDNVKFQIGANSNTNLAISIDNMTASGLGVDAVNVEASTFDENLQAIDSAISKVSAQRSQLGAWQNRLEHTIKNLDTSSENLQAAESRIRDVDMAKEMMEFTKNSILQQAATAMLAQANSAPQGVLQLLR